MIHRQSCLIRLFASLAMTVLLAEGVDFDGGPAIVLRNDKIELTTIPVRDAGQSRSARRPGKTQSVLEYGSGAARSRLSAREACGVTRPFFVLGRIRSAF